MNTKRITFAIITAALVAALVAVAAARATVGVDGLIGFGAVVALIAVAAADYRLEFRRVLGGK